MTTVNEIYNLDPVQSSDDQAALTATANHSTTSGKYSGKTAHDTLGRNVASLDNSESVTSSISSAQNGVSGAMTADTHASTTGNAAASNDAAAPDNRAVQQNGEDNEVIDLLDDYSSDSSDDVNGIAEPDSDIHSINEIGSSAVDHTDDSESLVSINMTDAHNTTNNVLNTGTLTSDINTIQHNNRKSAPNGIVGIGEYVDDSTANRRKSNNVRYFAPTDITLKCYNCGGVGHYAENCPHEKVYKPCYICGVRNHQPWKCPNDICFRCNGIGHRAETCTNQRQHAVFCILCGLTAHTYSSCTGHDAAYKADVKQTRCYICGELGHINCNTNKQQSGSKRFKHIKSVQYCANCAGTGHTYLTCTQKAMDSIIQINAQTGQPVSTLRGYDNDETHNNSSRLCYICNSPDHIKADCPELRNRRHTYSEGVKKLSTQHNNSYRSVSVSRNDTQYVERYDKPSPRDNRKRGRSRERYSDRERNGSSSSSWSASVSSQRSYTSNHRRKNG